MEDECENGKGVMAISTWRSTDGSDAIEESVAPGGYEELEAWLERYPDGIICVHYRVRPNVTACMEGGDKTIHQVAGQLIVDRKDLVGCWSCLEWLHA